MNSPSPAHPRCAPPRATHTTAPKEGKNKDDSSTRGSPGCSTGGRGGGGRMGRKEREHPGTGTWSSASPRGPRAHLGGGSGCGPSWDSPARGLPRRIPAALEAGGRHVWPRWENAGHCWDCSPRPRPPPLLSPPPHHDHGGTNLPAPTPRALFPWPPAQLVRGRCSGHNTTGTPTCHQHHGVRRIPSTDPGQGATALSQNSPGACPEPLQGLLNGPSSSCVPRDPTARPQHTPRHHPGASAPAPRGQNGTW